MLESTPERRQLVDAAGDNDLWMEDDGGARLYAHKQFGYSDYIRDVGRHEVDELEATGLIRIVSVEGQHLARWEATDAGREWLARAGQGSGR